MRPGHAPRLVLRNAAGQECDAVHSTCGSPVLITIERSGMLATCSKCGIVRKRTVKAVPLSREEEQRRRHERAIVAQDRGADSAAVDLVRRGVLVDTPAVQEATAP